MRRRRARIDARALGVVWRMTYDALPSFAARSEEGSATLGFSKSEHGACAWSQRSAFPASPAEDAEGVQRDPSARLTLALAEVNQQLIVMGMLEGPSAVGIAPGLDDADGLGDPLVWGDASLPQVVKPAEDIIAPPV